MRSTFLSHVTLGYCMKWCRREGHSLLAAIEDGARTGAGSCSPLKLYRTPHRHLNFYALKFRHFLNFYNLCFFSFFSQCDRCSPRKFSDTAHCRYFGSTRPLAFFLAPSLAVICRGVSPNFKVFGNKRIKVLLFCCKRLF